MEGSSYGPDSSFGAFWEAVGLYSTSGPREVHGIWGLSMFKAKGPRFVLHPPSTSAVSPLELLRFVSFVTLILCKISPSSMRVFWTSNGRLRPRKSQEMMFLRMDNRWESIDAEFSVEQFSWATVHLTVRTPIYTFNLTIISSLRFLLGLCKYNTVYILNVEFFKKLLVSRDPASCSH